MNCYEIKLTLLGKYEEPLDDLHYMDPAHQSRTVARKFDCTVEVWAEDERRAEFLALRHDYDCEDYHVAAGAVVGCELVETDAAWTEEGLKIVYQEGVK